MNTIVYRSCGHATHRSNSQLTYSFTHSNEVDLSLFLYSIFLGKRPKALITTKFQFGFAILTAFAVSVLKSPSLLLWRCDLTVRIMENVSSERFYYLNTWPISSIPQHFGLALCNETIHRHAPLQNHI